MTDPNRERRIAEVLERLDLTLNDPHVERVISAVRESSPDHMITELHDQGLLDTMLDHMSQRFAGRPLHSIPTTELVQIARDSVDQTLGLETPERATPPEPLEPLETPEPTEAPALAAPKEPLAIPAPLDTTDHHHMEQLTEVIEAYKAEKLSAADALGAAQEALRNRTETDPLD